MKPRDSNTGEPVGPMLIRTARAVGNMLQRMFVSRGFDISAEHWTIMANLFFRQNGQFQQQLADRTYKDKAAITRLVDGLEKRGLVIREEDNTDRRQKKIYLTEKGEKLMDELLPVAKMAQKRGLQGVEPEKMVVFEEVLQQIFKNAHARD
ncbi:MAG: MarR family transcriptional regulator [Deltaproteobacteria bacterium]|nr:MarR family transcriptional regulator [Deltaproteobacteria bacterium]